MSAIDTSHVDLQAPALAQQSNTILNIASNAQVKGNIIACAGGNNTEGCIASNQRPDDTVDGPVAASHYNQLDACLNRILYNIDKLTVWAHGIDLWQNLLILQLKKDICKLVRGFLWIAGASIKDQFCPKRAILG